MTVNFDGVFFDLDGTLLDSMQLHARTWQEIMAQEGIKCSLETVLRNEGVLSSEVVNRFRVENGMTRLSRDDAEALMQSMLERHYIRYTTNCLDKVRLFAGAEAILAGLKKAGIPTALVTSSPNGLITRSLSQRHLDYFSVIIGADDVTLHKPNPDPYLKAARALGLIPQKCLVVENAPAGIEAAVAAGATCFAVCSTLKPVYLKQAHEVFNDLAELRGRLGIMGAQAT